MVVTGFMWLLRHLGGCYGVYVAVTRSAFRSFPENTSCVAHIFKSPALYGT